VAGLALEHVSKRFGGFGAVHDVSLKIEDGEFAVFVGPSGCGKSTLLRLIAGLDPTTEGRITIGARDVTRDVAGTRGVAMVFQSYALYPHMTVFDNIAFPLQMERRSKAEIREQVAKVAATVKLDGRLGDKPAKLSGGQRQRVAIARAIVRKPQLFLMDEPLSNLDAALRMEMRAELIDLHKRLGVTTVYVTHDQLEAMTMADRIVVLNQGRIEQIGRPMDLYHRPRNRFVASFIGNPPMNQIAARLVGVDNGVGVFESDRLGGFRLPVGATTGLGDVTVGVRPEALHTAPPAGPALSLTVRPGLIERLGLHTIVHADLAGQAMICLFNGDAPVAEGQPLVVHAGVNDIHLFDADGQRLIDAGMTVAA
jgi:multiple sugar transport system ATP-binding protein